jgi:hypothetical protein
MKVFKSSENEIEYYCARIWRFNSTNHSMIKDWWFCNCFSLRITCIWYMFRFPFLKAIYMFFLKKKLVVIIQLIVQMVD